MAASKQPTTKKYQPKGLTILFEDKDIIVVEKPGGLLTIGTSQEKSRTAHKILNDYVRKGNPHSRNRVFIVHRLDRDTSGVLVFAKTEQSKSFLQEHWQETDKHYLTVVYGIILQKSGTISSYLAENKSFAVYSTLEPGQGKLSHTKYMVIQEANGLSLLNIHLLTGRKHQIRVHLSENGHPVVGDKRYGRGNYANGSLALHARTLSFNHPTSGKRMTFESRIPDFFVRLVGKIEIESLDNLIT